MISYSTSIFPYLPPPPQEVVIPCEPWEDVTFGPYWLTCHVGKSTAPWEVVTCLPGGCLAGQGGVWGGPKSAGDWISGSPAPAHLQGQNVLIFFGRTGRAVTRQFCSAIFLCNLGGRYFTRIPALNSQPHTFCVLSGGKKKMQESPPVVGQPNATAGLLALFCHRQAWETFRQGCLASHLDELVNPANRTSAGEAPGKLTVLFGWAVKLRGVRLRKLARDRKDY